MIQVTLPLPPNLANSRMHWAAKHRAKNVYWTRCLVAHSAKPKAPIDPCHATFRFHVYRQMDAGNLAARAKWAEDWLTHRGYIVDDSPAHLTPDYQQVTCPLDEQCLIVTLTGASP